MSVSAAEKIDKPDLSERDLVYSYQEGDNYVFAFMDIDGDGRTEGADSAAGVKSFFVVFRSYGLGNFTFDLEARDECGQKISARHTAAHFRNGQ